MKNTASRIGIAKTASVGEGISWDCDHMLVYTKPFIQKRLFLFSLQRSIRYNTGSVPRNTSVVISFNRLAACKPERSPERVFGILAETHTRILFVIRLIGVGEDD